MESEINNVFALLHIVCSGIAFPWTQTYILRLPRFVFFQTLSSQTRTCQTWTFQNSAFQKQLRLLGLEYHIESSVCRFLSLSHSLDLTLSNKLLQWGPPPSSSDEKLPLLYSYQIYVKMRILKLLNRLLSLLKMLRRISPLSWFFRLRCFAKEKQASSLLLSFCFCFFEILTNFWCNLSFLCFWLCFFVCMFLHVSF